MQHQLLSGLVVADLDDAVDGEDPGVALRLYPAGVPVCLARGREAPGGVAVSQEIPDGACAGPPVSQR